MWSEIFTFVVCIPWDLNESLECFPTSENYCNEPSLTSMVSRLMTLPFTSLLRTEAWDLVPRGSSCKCSARFRCCSCVKLGASSLGTNLIEPKQRGKRVWRDGQRCVPINSGRGRRAKDFWGWAKKSGLCKSASKEVCAFSAWSERVVDGGDKKEIRATTAVGERSPRSFPEKEPRRDSRSRRESSRAQTWNARFQHKPLYFRTISLCKPKNSSHWKKVFSCSFQ